MVWVQIILLSIIGAIIGWTTNVIAIKLIFRPLNPIKIPIFNFHIQGLIPKRRTEIARSIGHIVETELVSIKEIIDKLIEEENKGQIISEIKKKIRTIAEEKMPSIIPGAIRGMILVYVDEIIDSEGENAINELSEKLIHKAASKVSISEIIEEKINKFELEKLEEIIISIAKKELKHIELLGGLIGFVIGLMQAIIILQF
ncbi:DUF445 domain-containing protein [Paramaledivibacter caminithermalis]|uniref:DUF445 family protein n=1 Tax=Paramaledivibacter caminithermalis (strain DSM 15212 / CIP 107654 / DViRD3) TaxID=1121301 RepID=A0A1M6PYV3_PARC5|nr:DUF445 family protein [Paramaledivibacter caminithermalis]SHK13092.1 Protein of unknown function [Paramaledivibacter caminithermalis DSM 15212]